MLTPRSTLVRRVVSALDASPSRIPVIVGGCGSGRSTLLHQLHDRLGRAATQFVDVERTATTPERFARTLTQASPFSPGERPAAGPRAAFEAVLAFLTGARAAGGDRATFLFDEFLELRTFESFPGLRRVLHDFVDAVAASGNRFVLTSRYATRTLRLLRDRSARFEVIHIPALTVEDTLHMLDLAEGQPSSPDAGEAEFTARTVHALADGRPAYVRAIAGELAAMRERGGPGTSDAMSALTAVLVPDGTLSMQCRFSYELRLHRARGYGALKAILDVLADEEGLTLTEISQRLQRTPGSTKDYLSWLEDVDLVTVRGKRYSCADPVLRMWVRLNCRATAPSEDELAREVHRYALPRLPQDREPALALAAAGGAPSDPDREDRKEWGIIEID
jgi:hypothetical protein